MSVVAILIHATVASFLLTVLLLAKPMEAAWQPPANDHRRRTACNIAFPTPGRCFTDHGMKRSFSTTSMSAVDDEDGETEIELDVAEKRMVAVTSELELPFSAEVAYDAYSDLTRQPTWSSWLASVEYLDEKKQKSKWTVKIMGLSYSWTAVAVKYERPHTIQWKSTSGLQNFGTVKFHPKEDNKNTLMNVSISFVAPRAALALLTRSNKLTNVVRDKMVASSLSEFRDIVLENDLGRKE
jgi:uncharacterized membrane protein